VLRFFRSCGLALVLISLASTPSLAQRKVPDGVKVLLLSGGQREHHGYRDQALYLARTLEDTRRYQVTICEDAAILEASSMPKYDVIIVPVDRRDPESRFTESQQHALLDWVKAGHGYISIHGADNAPAEWIPEWKEMLGGIYSHVGKPDGKAIMGTYTIKIADKTSPITQGLDDFELKDELYTNHQMKDDVKPLATIDYKGTTWPVAWTYQYGKGRVFHTSLGHKSWKPGTDDPLHNPNLTKLIVQGIDWVSEPLRRTNAE
jgi:type 1 glutamine amidotransferase